MLKKIKLIIEDNDTKTGQRFDIIIQILIIISLISFSIETLPDLASSTKQILKTLELFTIIIFTAEYLLRLIVADKKIKFIFSFYGIIDLAAILPFYISSGLIDLRSMRTFRLIRIFRILKILRYSKAINRFHLAFKSVKEEMILFLVMVCFILFVSSTGIYYFENQVQPEQFKSVFHCLWWAIVTLTTVGYGDVYPISLGGRLFAAIIMMIGIGVVAVPSGLIASAITKVMQNEK